MFEQNLLVQMGVIFPPFGGTQVLGEVGATSPDHYTSQRQWRCISPRPSRQGQRLNQETIRVSGASETKSNDTHPGKPQIHSYSESQLQGSHLSPQSGGPPGHTITARPSHPPNPQNPIVLLWKVSPGTRNAVSHLSVGGDNGEITRPKSLFM